MPNKAIRVIKTRKVKFWLPLANPETLFTCFSWATAIEYVADHLREQKLKPLKAEDPIKFSIETFDFLKLYNKRRDFNAIYKKLSRFSEVKSSTYETTDRDAEPQVRFAILGKPFLMGIYQGAMKFCLSHGDGGPDFLSIDKFLKFVGTIEGILMGAGDPMRCNISMTAKLPHTIISVSCAYEDPPLESNCRIWKIPKSESRFVIPDFSIIFDR